MKKTAAEYEHELDLIEKGLKIAARQHAATTKENNELKVEVERLKRKLAKQTAVFWGNKEAM
jgi:regulator of replication initiation timing